MSTVLEYASSPCTVGPCRWRQTAPHPQTPCTNPVCATACIKSQLLWCCPRSYTLHIRGLTTGVDLDELKVRLERFGEVVDLQQDDGTVVAKFSKTSEAYEAQQKLTLGPDVLIEFGPQDADHYNRAKKRVPCRVPVLRMGSMANRSVSGFCLASAQINQYMTHTHTLTHPEDRTGIAS
ncbi:PIGC [Symbiodinium necroappetens]|uniref:PIGC protein n=1 Tax=Symbiodinium necroappetens TaxID=1628268 RepID=A0A812LHZ9_9DINO|nr:PIGC [Symbiodinium necroappetens]